MNGKSFLVARLGRMTRVQNKHIFHVFAKEQPDLNWKNPKVREEIYAMIRRWLDLGIDGFRLDAISHIQKELWDFKITTNPWAPFMNVKGIEDYMLDLKAIFC